MGIGWCRVRMWLALLVAAIFTLGGGYEALTSPTATREDRLYVIFYALEFFLGLLMFWIANGCKQELKLRRELTGHRFGPPLSKPQLDNIVQERIWR